MTSWRERGGFDGVYFYSPVGDDSIVAEVEIVEIDEKGRLLDVPRFVVTVYDRQTRDLRGRLVHESDEKPPLPARRVARLAQLALDGVESA